MDGHLSRLDPCGDCVRPTAFNDKAAGTEGNLWVGSKGSDGVVKQERLWRLDIWGHGKNVPSGIGISNGLDFCADGRSAYYADTSTRVLRRFNIDPHGGIVGSTDRVTFNPGPGDRDGLVRDDDGCIWVAPCQGWAVHRYSPEGELLAVVNVPVARPTAVALVRSLLVITSCSGWLDNVWEKEQPDAGKLFCVNAGVGGPATRPYRGPLVVTMEDGRREAP